MQATQAMQEMNVGSESIEMNVGSESIREEVAPNPRALVLVPKSEITIAGKGFLCACEHCEFEEAIAYHH